MTSVQTTRGRVSGVSFETAEGGQIETEVVVNCAGQWASAVGAMVGVTVPLHSAEHFYVVTEPFEGVQPDFPVMRDPDGYTYFKEEVGGLVVGGFEPEAKPWVSPDEMPHPFEFQLLDEDWEHFSVLMDNALLRIPALERTGIRKFYNGPETFTPDNQFILGEAPAVGGFFVGAGFNSVGIASAGGAGRALAEWIVEGEPTSRPDRRRPAPLRRLQRQRGLAARPGGRGARAALRDPVAEPRDADGPAVPALAGAPPARRRPTPTSAARWAGSAPTSSRPRGSRRTITYAWGKQNWLPWSAAEQPSTRTGVTVFDQTSFSKYLLRGPSAGTALQWLCTADVDVPVGRTVYTGMLNRRGTYESDVTVTRTGEEEYLIVSSAATTERDQDHIRRHLPAGLAGRPRRRHVGAGRLRRDGTDVARAALAADPGGPVRRGVPVLDLAGDRARPRHRARHPDHLRRRARLGALRPDRVRGRCLRGPARAGPISTCTAAATTRSTRSGWTRATAPSVASSPPTSVPSRPGCCSPASCGPTYDFLGRAAVEKVRAAGPSRRLVSLRVDDPEAMLWGGELMLRDGRASGQVTSAAWSETFGCCVGLAWVWDPAGAPVDAAWVREASYEVDVGGERHAAEVSLKPWYDTGNERIRS